MDEATRLLAEMEWTYSDGDPAACAEEAALTGLTFGNCLPPALARSVLEDGLTDADAIAAALHSPCRTVVS